MSISTSMWNASLHTACRDYYDPLVKASVLDGSGKISSAQAGRMVDETIGRRLKHREEAKRATISRQTVRNIILRANLAPPPDKEPMSVDTLHIQLDEKHVHTQGTDDNSHEVKAAVIHTGVENVAGERNRLANRRVLAETESAYRLRQKLPDHITTHYESERLRRIIVSGDGAGWIKHSTADLRLHRDMEVTYVLDRFHTDRAINHITPHPNIRAHLKTCVRQGDRKHFRDVVRALERDEPERALMIRGKADYIERHWGAIQNQKDPRFTGCSMESLISHVFAAVFTDRPKGYSRPMMTKLLELRTLEVNGEDLKALYLKRHTGYETSKRLEDSHNSFQEKNPLPGKNWMRDLFKRINQGGFPLQSYS